MTTRYHNSAYIALKASKGRMLMAKAAIRGAKSVKRVTAANKQALASAKGTIHRPGPGARSFRREQPESRADDAAAEGRRDRRHDPGAREQVIRLPCGAGLRLRTHKRSSSDEACWRAGGH